MKKVLLPIFLVLSIVIICSCSYNETDSSNYDLQEDYYEFEETVDESDDKSIELKTSYDDLPDPEIISADFEVAVNPDGTFVIETNLPDQTELSLTLKGKGYLAQGKAFVEGGKGISERFTNRGKQLKGDYVLEVLMPIPSVQNEYVKHFIGDNGEYLTGPYIKGALGSVVVSKEFDVSFFPETDVIDGNTDYSEERYDNLISDNSSETMVYYRTPTGKMYHLDSECGGKNSYVTSSVSELTPCSKCVK